MARWTDTQVVDFTANLLYGFYQHHKPVLSWTWPQHRQDQLSGNDTARRPSAKPAFSNPPHCAPRPVPCEEKGLTQPQRPQEPRSPGWTKPPPSLDLGLLLCRRSRQSTAGPCSFILHPGSIPSNSSGSSRSISRRGRGAPSLPPLTAAQPGTGCLTSLTLRAARGRRPRFLGCQAGRLCELRSVTPGELAASRSAGH